MASSTFAAAMGGTAVFVFTTACEHIYYVAETSGQVAIGTSVYGLVRQLCDVVSDWRKQISLRKALAQSMHDYIEAASDKLRRPRDHEALAAHIRELRELRPLHEREYFDRALSELRNHGTGGDYALLGDAIQVADMQELAMRLA